MNIPLPFQSKVTNGAGGTQGMAHYLSRRPSPSNNKNQLKAEEHWNNRFTVNEIKSKKPVLEEQNRS